MCADIKISSRFCMSRPTGWPCVLSASSLHNISVVRFAFHSKYIRDFRLIFFFFLKKLIFRTKKLLHDLYTTTTLLVLLNKLNWAIKIIRADGTLTKHIHCRSCSLQHPRIFVSYAKRYANEHPNEYANEALALRSRSPVFWRKLCGSQGRAIFSLNQSKQKPMNN